MLPATAWAVRTAIENAGERKAVADGVQDGSRRTTCCTSKPSFFIVHQLAAVPFDERLEIRRFAACLPVFLAAFLGPVLRYSREKVEFSEPERGTNAPILDEKPAPVKALPKALPKPQKAKGK